MVLTTTHGFSGVLAECSRNYYSDPDEWAALFKVAGDDGKGRWRVLFPTRLNETDERAFDEAAIQERLQKFFPSRVPTRSCIATSITYTSALPPVSGVVVFFSPAIPRMSTIRWAG